MDCTELMEVTLLFLVIGAALYKGIQLAVEGIQSWRAKRTTQVAEGDYAEYFCPPEAGCGFCVRRQQEKAFDDAVASLAQDLERAMMGSPPEMVGLDAQIAESEKWRKQNPGVEVFGTPGEEVYQQERSTAASDDYLFAVEVESPGAFEYEKAELKLKKRKAAKKRPAKRTARKAPTKKKAKR